MFPSDQTYRDALNAWKRIEKRFLHSGVWSLAPPDVVATEFISILRFMLAPLRAEIALYFEGELIAATQPKKLTPTVDSEDALSEGAEIPMQIFFEKGGKVWEKCLSEKRKSSGVFGVYTEYFKEFEKPAEVMIGPVSMYLLVSGTNFNKQLVERFILEAGIVALLIARQANSRIGFASELRPLVDGLTHHLLEGFLDRLENDLAILIDGDAPDVWLLLADQKRKKFRFYSPPEKLRRIADGFGPDMTTRKLQEDVDGSYERDGFKNHLAACLTGDHNLVWGSENPVTVEHLECVAEKFNGWPMDTGIAGTVVSTGCAEFLQGFGEDYRVKAYNRFSSAAGPEKFEEFYRVQLAERIFIKDRANLIEIPILWNANQSGGAECAALLLVLFDDPAAVDRSYYAKRSLEIRQAMEPWYLFLEQHGRLVEWNRAILGHVVHESRAVFDRIFQTGKLDQELTASVDGRLRLLWEAYSFVSDNRGLKIERIPLMAFVDGLQSSAHAASNGDHKIVVENQLGKNDAGHVSVAVDLFAYLAAQFFASSIAQLSNLDADDDLQDEGERNISLLIRRNEPSRLIVQITHRATKGTQKFVRRHGSIIGRRWIASEGENRRRRAHLGLFYLGVMLRACEAEFKQPELSGDGRHVTWIFEFPYFSKL